MFLFRGHLRIWGEQLKSGVTSWMSRAKRIQHIWRRRPSALDWDPTSENKSRRSPLGHPDNPILPSTASVITYLVEGNKNSPEEAYIILVFKLSLKVTFKIKYLRNNKRLWNAPPVKTIQDRTSLARHSKLIINAHFSSLPCLTFHVSSHLVLLGIISYITFTQVLTSGSASEGF